jgi:hypothetical protein
MKVVIFLGPSLPLDEARAVLPDAVYLPPARQSDLLSAVGIHRPAVIGLIDGEFGQSLSVWHKEILYALAEGVAVYGASSMGALRAAETAEFGMVGIGRIYEMYASGELNDDDEVALLHAAADADYRNLSSPMVNLRATFQKARAEGVIEADVCERLTGIGKALFFPERTAARIFQEAEAAGVPREALDTMKAYLKESYVDLKRQDALELLRTIHALAGATPAPVPVPAFAFNRSHLFETLYSRDRRVLHDDFEVPLSAIANWAALHRPDFNELNFNALNRSLMMVLAELLQMTATEDEVGGEIQRFRVSRKLADDDALDEWRRRNDLKPAEFEDLVRQLAVCRKLHRWLIASRFGERTTRLVLDELRLRGEYESAAAHAARQERILEERHPDFKETTFAQLSTRDLVLDHLRASACKMPLHFKLWAEEAGFHTTTDLRVELLRARLARHYASQVGEELATALGGASASEPGSPGTAGTAR